MLIQALVARRFSVSLRPRVFGRGGPVTSKATRLRRRAGGKSETSAPCGAPWCQGGELSRGRCVALLGRRAMLRHVTLGGRLGADLKSRGPVGPITDP